jgi:hypothetical protein
MKQGTTALVATAMVLAGASALHAQPLPPMDGSVYYGARAYYGGRAVPPPVYAPDPAMPSYEVARILRVRGFLPLSGPVRRGGFYVVSAVHPRGDDGRVVIDAYTGEVVDFVPASQVSRASRRDEMVLVYQGSTFPPPDAPRAVRPVAAPPMPGALRGVPRPPAPVPRVASRVPPGTPLVTPKPRPEAAPQRPDTAQAPPVPAPVETKPAAASPPLAPKPVERAPLAPIVQPTQPLPPVQTME